MAASESEASRGADGAALRPSARLRADFARPDGSPAGTVSRVIVIDVTGVRTADIGTVGDLARIALAARRHGLGIRIVGATLELAELLALSGLSRVLCVDRRRSVEPGR